MGKEKRDERWKALGMWHVERVCHTSPSLCSYCQTLHNSSFLTDSLTLFFISLWVSVTSTFALSLQLLMRALLCQSAYNMFYAVTGAMILTKTRLMLPTSSPTVTRDANRWDPGNNHGRYRSKSIFIDSFSNLIWNLWLVSGSNIIWLGICYLNEM